MLDEIKERLKYLDTDELRQFDKLLEIQQHRILFAKKYHRNMRTEHMNFRDFPHIRALYEEISPRIVLQGSAQCMKALHVDEPVLTPRGWVPMGQLLRGDEVVTVSGGTTRITGTAYYCDKPLFRIKFSNGVCVRCCADHLWQVQDESHVTSVLNTASLIEGLAEGKRYFVPTLGWSQWVSIVGITPDGRGDAQCIAVEHPSRLYVTRSGILTHNSEWMIIDHLASAYCGLNIFFVLPKVEAKAKYVQSRVNRAIGCSDFYKSVSHEGGVDSMSMKVFGRGIISYVGSNVFGDFTSQPCDKGMVDEVDLCTMEHLPLIDDRLKASPFKFRVDVSNPKFPNTGINAMLKKSDEKQWHLPCSACGKLNLCDWFQTVVKEIKDGQGNVLDYTLRDTEWRSGCRRDIHMICQFCGGAINRRSQKGRWIAKREHPVSGYHISGLCSLLTKVGELYSDFRAAQNDDNLMTRFYTMGLGIPRAIPGASISVDLLESMAVAGFDHHADGSDSSYVPGDSYSGNCVLGMDISNGGTHDVAILYVTARGKRVLMYTGKVSDMNEVRDLCVRYNVQLAVIDIDPETTMVRAFQDSVDFPVWLCRYRTTDKIAYNHNEMEITANRTQILDLLHQELRKGKFVFPKNFRNLQNGQWLKEIIASQRELTETGAGKREYKWTPGNQPDHSHHALSYAAEAARLFDDSVITY